MTGYISLMSRVKRLRNWGWVFAVLYIPVTALMFPIFNISDPPEATSWGVMPADYVIEKKLEHPC